jgi:hypothetical protein
MHTSGILEIKCEQTELTPALLFKAKNDANDGPNTKVFPKSNLTAAKLIEDMTKRVEAYLKKKDNCKSMISDLMSKFKKVGTDPLLKEMRKSDTEWLEYTIWTEEFVTKGTVINTPFESKEDKDKKA